MTAGQCVDCERHVKRLTRDRCAADYRRLLQATAPPCSVDECIDRARSKGMCNAHYLRMFRNGTTAKLRVVRDGCDVPGCAKPHFGRGYCQGHYHRLTVCGDLREDVPLRPLRPGDGFINAKGYRVLGDGRLEHRVVMEEIKGRTLLPGENVHHKNGVRDDNRSGNLELWDVSQPAGQREEDLVAYAVEMLTRHAPHLLAVQEPLRVVA